MTKTLLDFRPCAKICVFLFAFATLPPPNAQCGSPLGRALGAIKNRVDHALNKVGIGRKGEPSPPEPGDPGYAPPPVTGSQSPTEPSLRQPSSKPANANGSTMEKHDATARVKSPGKHPSPTTPVSKEKPNKIAAGKEPANGAISPTKSTDTTPRVVSGSEAAPVPPPVQVSFAKPVPGKRGFVYAPGATEDIANILDVRGSVPGQKMRDPRTGTTFLVP